MKRILLLVLSAAALMAQSKSADLFRGLELRNIGPMLTPGRIADVAVDPRNGSVWYVATASSGLWKTTNHGETFTPIFDDGGSYSLGCVTLDPKNPDVVWLGTGENQSQRAVGYGDGVYKSTDGGRTWTNMGLPNSEHIAKIFVDPRNSNVVFVASQGPLWAGGGDRGLYKTTDGGRTWKPVLQISENTGVADLVVDPRNPDVMYASSYQRRRHTSILIGGGPESNIYKTTDGGATWKTIMQGMPAVDRGRIALAISPQKPDVLYANVAAALKQSGFYKSENGGETWVRQSDYIPNDPQYYGEIYADPHQFDRVYAVDVAVQVTGDGGKTFRSANWGVHSDNHSIWIDPKDAGHIIVGNDGGLYETWDGGRSFRHFLNLSTTQYYRVTTDNALPFYNVYGGTQDNGSSGGPSRTLYSVGIRISDAVETGGGDGFQSRSDPEDPNTLYTLSQNAALLRVDLRTGERKSVRPALQSKEQIRWRWDVPFLISPHSHTRLYIAGNKLLRSDDRGETWRAVSPDLTRQIDRDTIPVMGKLWGPDAVWKNVFTDNYGNSSAMDESPIKEGLLFVGTDDGLVQISEDGGANWRRIEKFPGVPEMTFIADLHASSHDANTLFAAFNNYQRGDFKPYLLKSTDLGRTWTSIASNLPPRDAVWSIIQDPVKPNLLFVGTEFGVSFSYDGGRQWNQLKGGMPTIAVRDLEIQKREGDLVMATFGRGFYVLDDISALRALTPDTLSAEGLVFPLRRTPLYQPRPATRAYGNYTLPNPPFGAEFTYYLRDPEQGAKYVLAVTDEAGKTVRTLAVPASAGLHRATWELRAGDPPERDTQGQGPRRFGRDNRPLVAPGKFKVALAKVVNGQSQPLGQAQTFEVYALQ
jgi:photosystem II stability/assembly factor-like uncharacterized protein